MKYTQNFPLKLLNMGYTLKLHSDNLPDDDSNLQYEVWEKGAIEVTIYHYPTKKVEVSINPKIVKCPTLEKLQLIDRVLN